MLEICARNSTKIIKKLNPTVVNGWRKQFNKEEKQRAAQRNLEFKEINKEDLSYSGNYIRKYITFSQKFEVLKKVEGLEKYIPVLA